MFHIKVGIISVLLIHLEYIHCTNITQVESLYANLFQNYSRKLFPLIDHNDTVKIHCTVGIVSINNFDELSGEIELTVLFYLQWVEERLNWTPSEFGGKSILLVHPEDIWLPQIYVLQSFDKIQEITNVSMMVRLLSSGQIVWNVGTVLKLVCSVDVTYFPFDTQNCQVTIAGWAYTNDELMLYTTESTVSTNYLSQNSQWIISSATAQNRSEDNPNFPPSLNIVLSLKRRNDFFIVYIIIPMIFLGCINNLVFVMPANSGERTSVAITTFLSFIVFMQMINSTVPQSSEPMAYIYYYLLFLLIYSSTILFLCILSLRIYDRDKPVPPTLVKVVYILRCWWLKRKKKTAVVMPERKMSSVSEEIEMKNNYVNENTEIENDHPVVTWKLIGKTFDLYCLLILYFICTVITSVTFTNLYYNQGF